MSDNMVFCVSELSHLSIMYYNAAPTIVRHCSQIFTYVNLLRSTITFISQKKPRDNNNFLMITQLVSTEKMF